jgi:octaprenyl-diphosphate synthase
MAQYGHNLGCAFQLVDDLLDYTADEKILGKATGADLREGKLTLPLIHALANAPETDRQQMETIIRNEEASTTDFNTILELVTKHGGIAYTKSRAKGLVEQAKQGLNRFEPSKSRSVLEDMAEYVLAREM